MQSESIIISLNKSLTSETSDNDDTVKDFISRIKTFLEGQKWTKKPLALSPAVCSQYGWKCIKSDLLECVTCSAELSAHEPKLGNFIAYKACICKMISDLRLTHGKHCPWPLTPLPDNLVKMIAMPKEEALAQFLKRFKSCLPFRSSFPKIEESVMENLKLTEHQNSSLYKMAGISNEDANLFGKTIVSLAVTGWVIEEGGKPVLKCNNCQRSVFCDSFSLLNSGNIGSKDSGSDTDIEENMKENEVKNESIEPPTKKQRISFVIKKGEPFDPLYEHRPWCLWINNGIDNQSSVTDTTASPEQASNIPGWKIFLKSLVKNVSDNQAVGAVDSPSREQIRNVKNLLETWADTL